MTRHQPQTQEVYIYGYRNICKRLNRSPNWTSFCRLVEVASLPFYYEQWRGKRRLVTTEAWIVEWQAQNIASSRREFLSQLVRKRQEKERVSSSL